LIKALLEHLDPGHGGGAVIRLSHALRQRRHPGQGNKKYKKSGNENDAVPGIHTTFKFTPTKSTNEMRAETGNSNFNYEMACTEIPNPTYERLLLMGCGLLAFSAFACTIVGVYTIVSWLWKTS
jgi:hypothetical protein